jgi:hypothetical protein
MSDQLPPADELYQVRQQIRELTERERELKSIILQDPSARTGNAYAATIKEVTANRVDIKELRAAYPTEVAEHTHPVTDTRVELSAISEDGELTPIRRTQRSK